MTGIAYSGILCTGSQAHVACCRAEPLHRIPGDGGGREGGGGNGGGDGMATVAVRALADLEAAVTAVGLVVEMAEAVTVSEAPTGATSEASTSEAPIQASCRRARCRDELDAPAS